MRALVLSANRWDGVLEVGVFRFARFLRGMGYDLVHYNLEGPRGFLSRGSLVWPLPRKFTLGIRPLWDLVYSLNSQKLKGNWDVLMVDSSHMVFFANRIEAGFKIYRMNDLLEGFSGLPSFILKEEEDFLRSCDLVLCAHRSLLKKVGYSSKAHLLPNPIDLSLFPESGGPEPYDLASLPRPRVVYVGAISHWFDWDTVLEVAGRLKDYSFVLIGPTPKISGLPENVYTLGPKKHRDVHLYLYHCDAAWIPFKVTPLIEAMDFPNKVLEYFSMGLRVVSVYWENFQETFPQVLFYRSADQAVHAIEEAVALGKDPSLRRLVTDYSVDRIGERFKELLKLS